MVAVVVVMMMVMAPILFRLIDEVDDADPRVGISPTVHDPATGKNRGLAGRGCIPADLTPERETI